MPPSFFGRLIQRHLAQRAGAQVVGDDKGRLVDDALAGDRRGAQGIAVIGAQIAGDRHLDVAFGPKTQRLALLR